MNKKILLILITAAAVTAMITAGALPSAAAIRRIVPLDDPTMDVKCREVTDYGERLWDIIDDLWDTILAADDTVMGISAPNVGLTERICIIRTGIDKNGYEMINPVIIEKSGSDTSFESCLSAPYEHVQVERPTKITVEYYDRNGEKCTLTANGYLARVIAHEIDHLDGITHTDRANSKTASAIADTQTTIIISAGALVAGLAIGLIIGKTTGKQDKKQVAADK